MGTGIILSPNMVLSIADKDFLASMNAGKIQNLKFYLPVAMAEEVKTYDIDSFEYSKV